MCSIEPTRQTTCQTTRHDIYDNTIIKSPDHFRHVCVNYNGDLIFSLPPMYVPGYNIVLRVFNTIHQICGIRRIVPGTENRWSYINSFELSWSIQLYINSVFMSGCSNLLTECGMINKIILVQLTREAIYKTRMSLVNKQWAVGTLAYSINRLF
jgi:hypothetical protein